MFPDQMSEAQLKDIAVAASVTVGYYDKACADPKVVIPTALHAAILHLRQKLEGK